MVRAGAALLGLLELVAVSGRLAGTVRKGAPERPWPCEAAAPPTVEAGQLRSGDAPLTATVTPDGVAVSAARGAYAVWGRRALRAALDGSWLYFYGDSSLRGVYLSLLQQVQASNGSASRTINGTVFYEAAEWMAARDPGDVAGRRISKPRGPDSLAMGWIDRILDVRTGDVLYARSRARRGGLPTCVFRDRVFRGKHPYLENRKGRRSPKRADADRGTRLRKVEKRSLVSRPRRGAASTTGRAAGSIAGAGPRAAGSSTASGRPGERAARASRSECRRRSNRR